MLFPKLLYSNPKLLIIFRLAWRRWPGCPASDGRNRSHNIHGTHYQKEMIMVIIVWEPGLIYKHNPDWVIYTFLQFPLGIHAAACVRVGNALGAGNTSRAIITCKVALVLSGMKIHIASTYKLNMKWQESDTLL